MATDAQCMRTTDMAHRLLSLEHITKVEHVSVFFSFFRTLEGLN